MEGILNVCGLGSISVIPLKLVCLNNQISLNSNQLLRAAQISQASHLKKQKISDSNIGMPLTLFLSLHKCGNLLPLENAPYGDQGR